MELIAALCISIAEDRATDWKRPEFWQLEPIHSERTKALEQALVELGADAIPDLLAHVDDPRPAGFKELHEVGFLPGTSTSPDWEVEGRVSVIRSPHHLTSDAWIAERNAVVGDAILLDDHITLCVYPVAVGDVCFLVLGKIVNRNYVFVRRVPSNVTHLRSPVHQKWLAEGLRAEWGGSAITENLRQSLYADLGGRRVQIMWPQPYHDGGAAERLKLYFPDEYASLARQARAATGELFTPAGTDIKVRRSLFQD